MKGAEVPYMAIEERIPDGLKFQRLEAYLVPAVDIRKLMPSEDREGLLLSSIPMSCALEFPETLAAWRDVVIQMANDGHLAAVGGDRTHITYVAIQIAKKGGN